MSTPVTVSGNIDAALKDILDEIFMDEVKDLIWPKCGFVQKTTDQEWVQDQEYAGLGMMPRKQQGATMAADSIVQGYSTRYTQITYALSSSASEEAKDFNRYDEVLDLGKQIGISAKRTQEQEHANIFIRAFTSGYTGGDGIILCSASHKLAKGGTYSNTFSTQLSLSEVGIETMLVNLRKLVGPAGIRQGYRLKKLVLPSDLMFRGMRILKSEQQNDTANNAINALKGMGIEAVDNPWLTSATNWFGISDAAPGLKTLFSKKPKIQQTNHERSLVIEFTGSQRFATGWTDPRAVYGSSI